MFPRTDSANRFATPPRPTRMDTPSDRPVAYVFERRIMKILSTRRLAATGLAAAVLAGALAGCSSSSSGGTSAGASGGGTYTIWDPYPQFDNSSAWVQLLTKCGTDAGVTVKRTGFDTTDLTSKVLLAAQQG